MLEIKEYVKKEKENIKEGLLKNDIKPKLAIIQVGNNQASNAYVKGKIKDCEEVGIDYSLVKLEEDISQKDFEDKVIEVNKDSSITGLLVQLPIPKHLSLDLDLIDREKDVDGFKIDSKFIPCTPYGIIMFLESNNISLEGKNAVVIGRSEIVGKPMAQLLQDRNATVTICHSKTKDISFYTKNADIIIVAAGKRNVLTKDMIGDNKPIVIDVGINRDENNKLCGDCDYLNLVDVCSYISPVPGGVGLLTRLALIKNLSKTI